MAPRLPPHSVEAEEYLLSCCLLDGPDVISRAIDAKIDQRSFYIDANGVIFARLSQMLMDGKPIDTASLVEELRIANELDWVGGMDYVMKISSRVPTTADSPFFIEKVKHMSVLRQIIRQGGEAIERCHAFDGDTDQFANDIIQLLFSLNTKSDNVRIKPAAEAAAKEFEEIVAGRVRGDENDISVGWRGADQILRPFRRKELVVLAARPGRGKSSFMRMSAAHNAYRAERETLIFSLEADKREVVQNIVQAISGVNHRDGASYPTEKQKLYLKWMRDIGSCPRLYISTECKFPAIVARIRQMHAAKPLDVVYIDYLQLIEEKMAKGETRDMMIGRITRQLKNLAMELNIVIVILSQLNRAQERENNREPMLSDLRESGNIEQDADRVIFIHWPDTNPLTKNPQKPDDDTVSMVYADLMQKKGRNVGVHYLGMNFHKTAARFLEIDRSTQPQS